MSEEKKEIKIKTPKNFTPEQIQMFKTLGFEIKETEEWTCTCPFCMKEFKRETQKQASRSLSVHLGKCKNYKFTKAAQNMMPNPKEFKMGDIAYLLEGEFPKGYKPHKDNKETLKTIREISKNMENK